MVAYICIADGSNIQETIEQALTFLTKEKISRVF